MFLPQDTYACLAKFERNFTKHNFYFITQFMSKRNFYFETGYPYFSATSVFRTPPAGNVHAQAARSCPPSPGIGYYIE